MKRSLLALLLVGCASEAATNAGTCIAPANPGGGWDFTCRTTAQMLGTLAPGGRPLLVTNIPGDGGGVAFARMVNDKFPKAAPYGFEIVDAAIERCESESIENLRVGQISRFFYKFAAN